MKKIFNKISTGLSLSMVLGLFVTGLVCGFNSAEETFHIRRQADNRLRELERHEKAADIENHGNGIQVWGIRSEAGKELLNPAFILAVQFLKDAPDIIERESSGNAPKFPGLDILEPSPHLLAPLLAQDGASNPRLFAALPRDYEDALDESGYPVRWRIPGNLIAGYSTFRPSPAIPKIVKPDLIAPAVPASPRDYRNLVENFAKRFNLNVALVMAIIHSESNFSPTLVSSKSAMGLMQLLPSTASDEVHRFLYGQRGRVSYAELKVPETNIRYGTAYLHILLNRYFSGVKNGDVRESCAIASYNMGPNRFLKLYGRTPEQAVANINSMSAEQFYQDLHNRLPVRETKYYVNKVRKMKRVYAGSN